VKNLGGNVEPLAAKEWKPVSPPIGAPTPPPPPPPKAPPILKPTGNKKPEFRRR
jgi:hypothetical protein